jgi:hypothetical protein
VEEPWLRCFDTKTRYGLWKAVHLSAKAQGTTRQDFMFDAKKRLGDWSGWGEMIWGYCLECVAGC